MKILIGDDHAIVRRGIKDILLEEFPSAVIGEVGDTEDLLQKARKEDWRIIITDISMPGRSSLDAIEEIRAHQPQVPILVLSIYPEEQYAIRVLRAGAAGYLNKDMAPEELVYAVRHVLSGRKYITQSVAEKLAFTLNGQPEKPLHEYLSNREFEVCKMLASGKSVSAIGAILHLSATTISTYRSRILAKMNMKTNADLTQYAIENKLM